MMKPSNPDTRERLIQAARDLIFTRGYENVGVQELCERASVKKGSFYHFFPSKRDLTLAALEQHWKTFRFGIEQCVTAPLPPLERVKYLFNHLHLQYSAISDSGGILTGCAFGSLTMEVSANDPILRKALERIFLEWEALFARVFQEAILAGDLPVTTNAQQGGRALLAYLEGILLLVKTTQNPDVLIQLSPTAAQLELFGHVKP
jgi:TetR/AcrR family transcriptional regulator, transcriptional repressor for nem operon